MKGRLPIAEDFTPIFEHFGSADVSFSEADALKEPFWDVGEPARLREDIRFRRTPWGRWIRSDRWIANDRVLAVLAESEGAPCSLDEALAAIPARLPLVFCTGDTRFRLEGRTLTLTAEGRKALPRPRRRNLTEKGLTGRAETLRKRLLAPAVSRPPPESDEAEPEVLPGCALALDDDGLRIVIPPLGPDRVPGFLKRLRLLVAPTPLDFPLARLRAGHEAAVPPTTEPYQWTGFVSSGEEADDPDLLPILEGLATPGFASGIVTVFRTGPDGRTWRQAGRTLRRGQIYRLLFPPDVPVPAGVSTTPAALWHDGWRVWELGLPDEVSADLAALLGNLGLEVGSAALILEWCGDPPSAWANLAGQPAPVFDSRDRIALRIRGRRPADGAAVMLLVGEHDQTRLPLDEQSSVVRCDDLAAGPYVVELVAQDVAVPRVRVWFEVRENAGAAPRAEVAVLWQDAVLAQAPDEDFRLLGDLSEIIVEAPPCWPVALRWHGLDARRPVRAHADRDGLLVGAFAQLGETVARDVRARLDIGFAELGTRHFEHIHLPRDEEFRATLAELLPRAEAGLPPDVRVLKQHWFEPLLRPLGYRIGEPEPDDSTGAVSWRLTAMVEVAGRIAARPTTLLVLVPAGMEVQTEAVRRLADRLAGTDLRRVLVTDGLRWRRLVRRQVPGPTFDLRRVLDDELAQSVALEALTPEIA